MAQGEQAPEFRTEKQAQRIIALLIRYANDIALTLAHDAVHYEPLFYQNRVDDKVVTIIDEWCCGYVKGMSLDVNGWGLLREAHPEWLEPIELYGTKDGWDRLKTLVDGQPDSFARHQNWVDRIAPAARQIHAFWLARRDPEGEVIRGPIQPIRKAALPGRNDKCPCGSGKKYKHCHGAPETLH